MRSEFGALKVLPVYFGALSPAVAAGPADFFSFFFRGVSPMSSSRFTPKSLDDFLLAAAAAVMELTRGVAGLSENASTMWVSAANAVASRTSMVSFVGAIEFLGLSLLKVARTSLGARRPNCLVSFYNL